jgi:hypothetical protein
MPTMLILRGNSAPNGKYPDERGNYPAWPAGALHVWAATKYARLLHFKPVVLDIPGQPQSETSPQATEALKQFLEDQSVRAFYGFSGGGINLRHILHSLAKNHPETLERIEVVVVIGAPEHPGSDYHHSTINDMAKKEMAKKRIDTANWKPGHWWLIYKANPPKWILPKGVPKDTSTHMFGPEWLLSSEMFIERMYPGGHVPPDRL